MANYCRTGTISTQELDLHQVTFEMSLGARDTKRRIDRVEGGSYVLGDFAFYLAFWMKASSLRTAGVPKSQLESIGNRHSSYRRHRMVDLLIDEGILYRSSLDPAGEPLFAIVQDTFGEYLAARWIARHAETRAEFVTNVTQLLVVGRFDVGWRYALQLIVRGARWDEADVLQALRVAAGAISDVLTRSRVSDLIG